MEILHKSQKIVLPDHTTITNLTNTFGKYFIGKIAKLRSGLVSKKEKICFFWIMSEDGVLKIFKSNPN